MTLKELTAPNCLMLMEAAEALELINLNRAIRLKPKDVKTKKAINKQKAKVELSAEMRELIEKYNLRC